MDYERRLLNCLPVGVILTDAQGTICCCNEVLASLMGLSVDQIEGQSLFTWWPELADLTGTRPSLPYRRSDDWLSFRVRVQDWDASHQSSDSASPSLAQLLRVWTFQAEASRELEQTQADFIATVSHELRTPLTSIKGFVDTLLNSRSQLGEVQLDRFLRIIKSQANRLTYLVEDILTVSRIQSGRLKNIPQRLRLTEVAERVLDKLIGRYDVRRVCLDLPAGLPAVWADPDRLEQIFTHLIDNALKYSEEGTPVKVRGQLDPEDEEQIRISVSDQGIGIAPEHLEQLFHRFNRVDSPLTRQREGTGLGLYITKALVESLGGAIQVTSCLSQGSTFTVCLPAAQVVPQADLLTDEQGSEALPRSPGGVSARS
ncbi:cell wall metabolism sensor histidine kinase WalK [Leptolyngbya sp. FACHB-261]|uniref:sensor histidine kinase n=1 Tax=Leptolyngbya sp. FACHB-261 TaxID=2692806 RepID=UPI001687DA6A|nr:PAS domain-containing sensor histidine kinase [Leptolyngbya sp. FACHB-261]MBD2104588.1 PAS domain-containing sensor histidine kinase [Leptolyngbya sp. FACHB-261]